MVEEGINAFNKVTEKLDDAFFKNLNKKLEVAYDRVGLHKGFRYTNGGTRQSVRELFSDLFKSRRFGVTEAITYSTIVKNVEGCIEQTGSDGTRLLKNEFAVSG